MKNWFHGRNKRWLSIFDGVDDIDDKGDSGYIDLIHFLLDPLGDQGQLEEAARIMKEVLEKRKHSLAKNIQKRPLLRPT